MSDKIRNKSYKDVQFQNLGRNEENLLEQNPASFELSIFNDKSSEHPTNEASCKQEQNNDRCSWFQNIKTTENIDLIVNQFVNITKALQFFNNFQPSITSQKVLVAMLNIDEDIESVNQFELNNLGNKLSKKSAILIILCKNGDKPFIFWKTKAIGYFLTLKSYSNMLKVYDFIGEFLIKSLKIGHLGIFNFIKTKQDTKVIELHFLADTRDYNLLLLAAEAGDVTIAESLFKLGLSSNSSNKNINAQLLAYKNRHFDVLLMFLQNNLTYPLTMDISSCSNDIKEFHQVSLKLHNAIETGNEDNINQIIAHNPAQHHFYNSKNQSAPTVALISKQTDIYKLLITHNVHFGPHESTDEIMENFEYAERRDLREFHNEHAKDLPEKHLNALMTSSVVAHDVTDVNRKPDLVMGAFKLLNEILLIRIILKVVAASKKLQMVFDFNRESVEVADPTVDSNTFGLFYLTGRIYIGALQLLNNATKYETLGTMAHELCHYAMHLTFSNGANPYQKDDEEAKAEFERISKHCKRNRDANGFIKAVYDEYPEEAHHAELIVRVPHILAFYADEPEEIEKCQQTFEPLFEFFEHKVIPEMEKALPDIETRAEREIEQKIEKKDKKIVNLVKIIVALVISSFVVVGLLVLVLHKPELKFEKLSDVDQQIVRSSIVKYKNVEVRFNDLISDNSTIYGKLSSDHLRTLLAKDVLDLNDRLLKFTDDQITHKWEKMPKKLRQKFLSSNFTFQNQSLKLNDFYVAFPEAFNELSHEQIFNVLDGSNLTIGTLHKPTIENYIERKFSVKNSKKTKNLTEIVNEAKKSKVLILSAVAGAGKTVTFEYLTVKIKEKFPERWVSYVDLKKYINFYDDSEAFKIISKILNMDEKTKFEQEIFKKSFEIGNVDILWNGFDEISPTYSKLITNIFKNIKRNTKNVQFISTRPSYAQDLQSNLTVVPHELIPLKKSEQNHFLVDYFSSQSENTTKINQNVGKVERILKEINVGSSRDFNTPLMLRMVAEIQDDPKLQNSTNLYQIYELFVIKKNRIWSEKGELAKSASTDLFLTNSKLNIVQIYQKFAILQEKSIFGTDGLMVKLISLQILKKTFIDEALFPEITRLGILLIDDETTFTFSHRTFAEFFIAQYVIENVYSSDDDIGPYEAELRLILFYKILSNYDSKLIVTLMHAHIKAQNGNGIAFSESISQILKMKFQDLFFICLHRFDSQLTFLFDFFKKDHEILAELLQIDQKETIYTRTFDPNEFIAWKFSHKLKNVSRNYLTDEEFDKFLNGVDQKGKILLGKKVYELKNQKEPTDDVEDSENNSQEETDDLYDDEDEDTTESSRDESEEYENEEDEDPKNSENDSDEKKDEDYAANSGSSSDEEKDENHEESTESSSEIDETEDYEENNEDQTEELEESIENSTEEPEESGDGKSANIEGDGSDEDSDDSLGSGDDLDNSTLMYDSDDYTASDSYKKSIANEVKNSFWLFIDELKKNLTESERKELVLGLTSPNFFGYDSEFAQLFDLKEFELVWKEVEELNLTKIERKKLLTKALFDAARCLMSGGPRLYYRIECDLVSKIVINFTKKLLSNDDIFDIFYNENLIHKIIKYGKNYNANAFNKMQSFFNSVTNTEQQEMLYEKLDNGDDVYSSVGLPPLKILHLKLIYVHEQSDIRYYFEGQSKAKLQKFFINSQNFLLYITSPLCTKLTAFLKEIFEGNESALQELLQRKVKPLNLPIFSYGGIIRDGHCLRWLYYLQTGGFEIRGSGRRASK